MGRCFGGSEKLLSELKMRQGGCFLVRNRQPNGPKTAAVGGLFRRDASECAGSASERVDFDAKSVIVQSARCLPLCGTPEPRRAGTQSRSPSRTSCGVSRPQELSQERAKHRAGLAARLLPVLVQCFLLGQHFCNLGCFAAKS